MSQKPVLRLVRNPVQSAACGASMIDPAKIARQIGLGDPLTQVGWYKRKQDVLRTVRRRKMQRRSAIMLAASLLCASVLFVWQRHSSSPHSGAQTATGCTQVGGTLGGGEHGWGCR